MKLLRILLCLCLSMVSAFLPVGRTEKSQTTTRLFAEVKTKTETFRKSDFIASVAAKTGMNKKDSEEALKAVLETVQEQVAAGKRVSLAGFGTFTLKHRAARKGRNPQTGQELQIPASKSPGFSAAKAWKEALNEKKP